MQKIKGAGLGLMLATALFCFAFTAAAKNNSNHNRVLNNAIVKSAPTGSTAPQTITVTIRSVDYTVNISPSTRVVRRYNGRVDNLSELMTNDTLKIWGTLDPILSNTINATKIRDNSIQKLGASFHGTISDITYIGSGSTDPLYPHQYFTLAPRHRPVQKVQVADSTPVRKYQGAVKTIADLQNGYDVIVKGIWNQTNKIIYGVSWIKIRRIP